jgi:hypothetical protein
MSPGKVFLILGTVTLVNSIFIGPVLGGGGSETTSGSSQQIEKQWKNPFTPA